MARLKEIKASFGITLEDKGIYYKPNAEVLIEIDEQDTVERRKLVWKQAWDMVTEQVEKQIAEIK